MLHIQQNLKAVMLLIKEKQPLVLSRFKILSYHHLTLLGVQVFLQKLLQLMTMVNRFHQKRVMEQL
jgi:hypothetical protein